MRIYLDSCALSRPYDECLNDEIAQEVELIEAIFDFVDSGIFTRFVRLTQGGKGNWTEEREKALESLNNMTLDELVDYIKKRSKGPKEGQEVI